MATYQNKDIEHKASVEGGFGGATAILGSVATMAIGSDHVPKAILMVRKPMTEADYNNDGTNAISNTELSPTIAALRKMVKTAGTSAAKANGDEKKMNAVMAKMKGAAKEQELIAMQKAMTSFVGMTVQYNPSTIQFSAVAAGDYTNFTGPADAGVRQTVNVNRPSSITMKVQLIFDKINQLNAFSIYNQGFSFGTAASAVTNFVREYTVQPQVEGLISLLTMENTRQVIFIWSEMFFHGELQGVEASYTMFNKKGKPIRATVDLMIKQSDTANSFPSDSEYWNSAFTKAWGEAGQAQMNSTGTVTGTSTFF